MTQVLHEDGEAGATTQYKIYWIRRTVRSRLAHVDGRPLKAEEVRSLRPGYDLVFYGYDVSVKRILMDDPDNDGVPTLDIKITRITNEVRAADVKV